MKKYFKFPAESDLGIGVQYIEFDDDNWPIRQVDCYGDRLFNSNQGYHQELSCGGLCDQQLTESGVKLGEAISAKEFELKWNLSMKDLAASNSKKELLLMKDRLVLTYSEKIFLNNKSDIEKYSRKSLLFYLSITFFSVLLSFIMSLEKTIKSNYDNNTDNIIIKYNINKKKSIP